MTSRNILDKDGNIIGQVEMPDDTTEAQWLEVLVKYNPPEISLQQLVYERLEKYEKLAPRLLREIKTSNTLAGITTAQSDTMFSENYILLLEIREGAFPTALYRLQNTVPSGFMTQEMINDFIAKIMTYL
jgi:hypothetical protein